MKKVLITLFVIFATSASIFAQQIFQVRFPLKCEIGQNCWITNYVDQDSTTNIKDYKKGNATFDGNTATDFAIKDLSTMKNGVDVVAAASGFVVSTIDGYSDRNFLTIPTANQASVNDCGNSITVKHDGGWTTKYCNLKMKSIKVKNGDFVMMGGKIAQVGMSGKSEYPHLSFIVKKNTSVYDPFTGAARYQKPTAIKTLWTAPSVKRLTYNPVTIYAVGASDEIPTLANVRNEKYKNVRLAFFSKMIIVWVDILHPQQGDIVNITVNSLSGAPLIKQKLIVKDTKDSKLIFAGKKKPQKDFQKGLYNATITLTRPGKNINITKSFSFPIN